jgi:hypothetical protein
MASQRNWSTFADPAKQAERRTGAATSVDRHAATFAGNGQDFHAIAASGDTELEPVRGYVADWAFWARDAA